MKEICKLAREKGFKAKTFSTGWTFSFFLDEGREILITEMAQYTVLCEIQKWMRDELDVHIEVTSHRYKIKELKTLPRVFKWRGNNYNTYEEALEAGILETLKQL